MKTTLILFLSLLTATLSAQNGIDGYYTTGISLTGFGVKLDSDYSFRFDSRTCFGTFVDTGIYEISQDTIFFQSTLNQIDSLDLKSFADRKYRVDYSTDSLFKKMLYKDDKIYIINNHDGQEWISNSPLEKE